VDRIALTILQRGLQEDAAVLARAADTAEQRLAHDHPGHLEACGFELHRFYNVFEKALERICLAFENHLDKRGEYHERLIERMTLDLPGVRPAFLPLDHRDDIRDLKGFRHLFRHAYDIQLRRDRLADLSRATRRVATAFPGWCTSFIDAVARQFEE